MNIFLSLFIILIGGILGGFVFEKIRLPKLVWYIILGILIGPSLLNIVDDTLLSISSFLRQIALVIILTRSGLSLDINNLKRIRELLLYFEAEHLNDTNKKGKIVPRRVTGNCALHQRYIAKQVKRARAIALMPYTR